MTVPAGDSNWLWVRSRGVCAFPNCRSVLVVLDGTRLVTQGQRAHIRAETPGGPRFDPDYRDPNRYENLLLLCRDHHNLVDAQPNLYSVELLEEWKAQHEGPSAAPGPILSAPPPIAARYLRRDDVFLRLQQTVDADSSAAVVGLSGAGKTQLAADYFKHSAEGYSLRLWLPASDPTVMLEDLARAGDYLGVARSDGEPLIDFGRRIRVALEDAPGWLIVFDDAPSEDAIAEVRPTHGGHVIVTSQAQAWPFERVPVAGLTRAEACRILREHPAIANLDQELVEQVAELAGDLPLCLAQIMGYLDATAMEPAGLLQLFANRRTALLARGAPPDHLPIRVSLTSAVDSLTANAHSLLGAISVLASAPIPVPEFPDALVAAEGADVLGPLASQIALEDAIAELRRFSLVEREGGQMSCHEITQLLTRDLMTEDELRSQRLLALALVGALLPERVDRPDHVPAALALLPHALALIDQVESEPSFGVLTALVLNRLAPAYQLTGDNVRAEAELHRALRLLDAAGEDDLGMRGSILNNLSNAVADRGGLVEAVALARAALAAKEQSGAPPDSIALSAGTLGCHLAEVGQFDEALALHMQAIRLLEQTSNVRSHADAHNDAARVLRRKGDFAGSSEQSVRAVEIASADPDAWSELADANLNLALLAEDHDPGQALSYASAAVQACDSSQVVSTRLAQSLGSRGRLRCNLGDFSGLADLRGAIEVFEQLGGLSVDYGRALGNLGAALVQLGQESTNREVMGEGMVALRGSLEVLSALLPKDHQTVAIAETMLRRGEAMLWSGGLDHS